MKAASGSFQPDAILKLYDSINICSFLLIDFFGDLIHKASLFVLTTSHPGTYFSSSVYAAMSVFFTAFS